MFIAQSANTHKHKENINKAVNIHTSSLYIQTLRKLTHHTFTLEALFDQTPQQTPTVVAESGTHVVVRLEAVRHVDFEALLLELQGQTQFTLCMNAQQ